MSCCIAQSTCGCLRNASLGVPGTDSMQLAVYLVSAVFRRSNRNLVFILSCAIYWQKYRFLMEDMHTWRIRGLQRRGIKASFMISFACHWQQNLINASLVCNTLRVMNLCKRRLEYRLLQGSCFTL